MSARRGFTLIEMMIALVIGAVVVTLAYATLRAGTDTQTRVANAREADASTTAFRAMLTDALRHARIADAHDATGLHAVPEQGDASSTLSFVTRGIAAPLGGSGAWRVNLSVDSGGAVFAAQAMDSLRTPLRIVVRGVQTLALRFLAGDETWRSAWDDPTRLPTAVEVRFLDRDGRETMAALVARTAPVGGL